MSKKIPLLIITGPTASGKTGISLRAAEKLNCEIISADSMQIYRGMDIGTAKAKQSVRKKIKHHMIDIIDPDKEFSVADYKKMVDKIINEIGDRKKLPLMVGGTGLYIKAVVRGFLFPEMKNDFELRKKLEQTAEKKGNIYLYNMLKDIDPELAEKIHPNDLRRVIRGIEVYRQTGKTITYYKKKQKQKSDRYNAKKIGLTRNREELYMRINKRVEKMLDKGLVEEVEFLWKNDMMGDTAKQALGYKEIISYLEGDCSYIEAVRILKRNTRHFAKRQFSWFKRDKDIEWYNLSDVSKSKVLESIFKKIN